MIRAFLGGSFDPVHRGHLAMVDYLLAGNLADVVHVVPAWRSPFKSGTVVSATNRLAMAERAFAGHESVVVDGREVAAGRACYTVDSLAALAERHADAEWRLVVGGDNLAGFGGWREPERIQRLATVVVLGRAGADLSAAAIQAGGLSGERVQVFPDFAEPVSSTAIRDVLARGERSVRELVSAGLPPAVADFILKRDLYGPEPNEVGLVPDPD